MVLSQLLRIMEFNNFIFILRTIMGYRGLSNRNNWEDTGRGNGTALKRGSTGVKTQMLTLTDRRARFHTLGPFSCPNPY